MNGGTRTTTLIALCLLIAGLAPGAGALDEASGGAQRVLPSEADCGGVITVEIQVQPPAGTDSWVLEETPPAGTTVLQVAGGTDVAEYVEETQSVKWLSMGGQPATVSYTLELPQDHMGTLGPFFGDYRFHDHMSERMTSSGPDSLEIRCGSVLRVLPQSVECGQSVEVQVSLAPPPSTDSWIVDERPPSALDVVHVDPEDAGAYVAEHDAVRWISKNGGGALKTYQLEIPTTTPHGTQFVFQGEYRLHPGMSERDPIAGDDTLTVTCPTGPGGGTDPNDDGPTDDQPSQDENETNTPTVPDDGTIPTEDDLVPSRPGAPFVTRFLPSNVRCGSSFPVTFAVAPAIGTTSWILDEAPPAGVQVTHVDPAHQGEYLSEQHHVKWVALQENRTIITYQVTVGEDTPHGTVLTFTGESMAHPVMTRRVDVIGHDTIEVECGTGSSGSSGGGGGGGGGGLRPLRLTEPGSPPIELPVRTDEDAPPGAVWQALTDPLSGDAGEQVRLLFDDPGGLEILFITGSDLDGASLKVTLWETDPPGTAERPADLQVTAILSIEVEDGPEKGHEIEITLPTDSDPVPDPAFPVLLEPGPDEWSWIARAQLDGDRLVARGPCCSLRAMGYDLGDPEVQITLTADHERGRLHVESSVQENLGTDRVQLYLDDQAIAELSHPEGGYTFDLERLDQELHHYRIVAHDLAGRSAEAEQTWRPSQVEIEQEGPTRDPLGRLLIPLFLTAAALILMLFVATRLQIIRRRDRPATGSPDLFVTALESELPEGALMAREARVNGEEGSVANILLDDEEVPTIALLMGGPLQNVPFSVTKWDVGDPPEKSLPFPADADPLVILESRLPRVKGNHPLLITISLRDDQVVDPEHVTLFLQNEEGWRRVDRFLLTLDPDGRYRGTALADQHGMLLVAVAAPDPEHDEPTDRPPPVVAAP